MARRCLQRRRTRAYDQAVLECTQQAGDRVVSLAFTRLCRLNKARGALVWLSEDRALPPDAAYAPARLKNGHIIAGHAIPP